MKSKLNAWYLLYFFFTKFNDFILISFSLYMQWKLGHLSTFCQPFSISYSGWLQELTMRTLQWMQHGMNCFCLLSFVFFIHWTFCLFLKRLYQETGGVGGGCRNFALLLSCCRVSGNKYFLLYFEMQTEINFDSTLTTIFAFDVFIFIFKTRHKMVIFFFLFI